MIMLLMMMMMMLFTQVKTLTLIGSLINGMSEAFCGMRNFTKEGSRTMTLRSILRRLQSASTGTGSSGENPKDFH